MDQVRVQVNVNLNPIANAAVNDANICPGKQVTLSAAASQPPPLDPTAPLAFTWYNGASVIGSGVTLNVTPATTTASHDRPGYQLRRMVGTARTQ